MRSQALRSATIRIGVLRLLMLAALLGLAARAGQLTILNTEAAAHGEKQLHTRMKLPASRGLILDRNHRELAISVEAPSVYVLPQLVKGRQKVFAELSKTLGLDPRSVSRRVGQRTGFTYIARWIEDEQARQIEEMELPGVGIEYEPRRAYPAGRMAGALLGFADIDGHGRRGIEQMMDEWLRGQPQQLAVQRDARGRLLGRIAVDPRRAAGGDVVLTLDSGLQAQAEAALAEVGKRTRAKSGLVIAVEPQTGDILTLAEWPGFDPNEFRLTPYAQTRSRSFHDALEPGSTIKAFLIAAALDQQVLTTDTSIDTGEGWVRVPGKTIRDHHPYGVLDPMGLLRHSSNVGAVWVGEQLGSQAYHKSLTQMGFGHPTKSGFPSESAGLLNDWQKWRPVDQATASFGQGMNVTPIQLAMATAALANGGKLMHPRLVMALRSALGDWQEQPPSVAGQAIDSESAESVLAMMESVVSTEGTGRRAGLAGVRVAGKTGTAQHLDLATGRYSSHRYTAWFVGIAPADDPKIALVVALEEPRAIGHTGGAVAAPLFATVATSQLARYGIMTQPEPIPAPAVPTWRVAEQKRNQEKEKKKALVKTSTLASPALPTRARAVSSPPPKTAGRVQQARAEAPPANPFRTVLVPDFRGSSVSSARRIAASEALKLDITGASHGEVVGQAPPAGTVIVGRHRTVEIRVAGSREEG